MDRKGSTSGVDVTFQSRPYNLQQGKSGGRKRDRKGWKKEERR